MNVKLWNETKKTEVPRDMLSCDIITSDLPLEYCLLVCQRMTSDNSRHPYPPLPLSYTPQKPPAFSDKGGYMIKFVI